MNRTNGAPSAGTADVQGTPVDRSARPRVATAPVNWANTELAGRGAPIPYPAVLDEMVAAGYEATEHDWFFPSDPDALNRALAGRGLRLCAAYQALPFHDAEQMTARLAALDGLLRFLVAVGVGDLIVAFDTTPERAAIAGHVPADGSAGLTDDQWATTLRNLAAVGEAAAGRGLRTHFHNHVATYVETPDELDRLMAGLDFDLVDICFDVGHHAYGGGDPNAFITRHHDRIGHVHLKDVDPAVLGSARERRLGFIGALREFVFSELGQGMVDIPAIVRTLIESGYRGWVVVEQDTSPRHPTETARDNRRFLREHCGI